MRVRYNDIYFRLIAALIAAHCIVAFGVEETLFQMLLDRDYYISLLGSFVIASILINMVYFATTKLDKHYDWSERPVERVGLQVLCGWMFPGLFAFLLAFFYFRSYGIKILNTPYLKYDYPVILLMILLLNLYYLAFYFYLKMKMAEITTLNGRSVPGEHVKTVFIVSRGTKTIPLSLESISYFYRDNDYNFLRTFEKEDFLVQQTLDEVQQQLDDSQFFRANRRIILNFKAFQQFKPIEHGKLELVVDPPTKEHIIVSQKRAKSFREWINR